MLFSLNHIVNFALPSHPGKGGIGEEGIHDLNNANDWSVVGKTAVPHVQNHDFRVSISLTVLFLSRGTVHKSFLFFEKTLFLNKAFFL